MKTPTPYQEKDGVKVALNLGRAASDLKIEDGIIYEMYSNGGRVCLDRSKQASTRVEYSCAKQSEVGPVVLL